MMPGCLKWRGDHSHRVGDVLGPTIYGAAVSIASVDYDATTDVSTVRCVLGHDRPYTIVQDGPNPRFGAAS